MDTQLTSRYEKLQALLRDMGPVLVAFSGGVDSSLLAYTARQTLGKDTVLAVTADSETFPGTERADAERFAKTYDIEHRIITTNELTTINASGNTKDRCYHCKHALFSALRSIAASEGYTAIIEGSNTDDDVDYRPGKRALQELGIRTPLHDAGLSKQDIRELSHTFGLPTWDKPAYACLTSRFPYHVTITKAALEQVEKAEAYLHAIGFRQCRVRYYGDHARVEIEPEYLAAAAAQEPLIRQMFISFGFQTIELDPKGYRMGSMNGELKDRTVLIQQRGIRPLKRQ